MRNILTILLFLNLGISSAAAKYVTGYEDSRDSLNFNQRFGLGFYAGVNSPFAVTGTGPALGPSFLVYGRYKLSNRWEAELGFGGVFYYGKSLGYQDSKNIFDTIYSKNYMIAGIAYTSVPIIFKYRLSTDVMIFNRIQLLFGLRWLGASSVYGTGSYGIYSPANKDSFIYKSKLIPNLPKGANFMDVQGLAGIEWSFSRYFSARLMMSAGPIPIYPTNLGNVSRPIIGNYNNSIELGLNYVFRPFHIR